MARVLVRSFSISIDGFGAGPDQSLQNPLGIGGETLHEWFIPTKTFQQMFAGEEGVTGPEDDLAREGMSGLGAWILGRNMFGPVRGPWPDDDWRGWWGEEPPYHVPVFVLTHHPRPPLSMKGGTEFRFVTDGIHSALAQAREAAGDKDIRVGGGALTIRQYLQARLIDELHVAIAPVLLGRGESLFAGVDLRELGYECAEHIPGERAAAHVILRRRG